MSATEPSWDLYGTFLAVMNEGSLSGASRVLGTAQPTVRRHIEELEEALGVVLFTRAANGLLPTDMALAALPYAESMQATARALVRTMTEGQGGERGTVRLTSSEVIGGEVLPPILRDLSEKHPSLHIELDLSNRNQDLIRRDADIAVRMVRPEQASLVAKRLGDLEVGLFASEHYLSTRPAPRSLKELFEGHTLIGNDRDRSFINALKQLGVSATPASFSLRTDSNLTQLAAVRAGLGIGVCQVALSHKPEPLVRVLPKVRFALEMWLVMHEDLAQSKRVRTVFDHLAAALGEYASPRRGRAR